MGNSYSWPIIRLVQLLSMVLTLGCFVYVVVFLLFKSKEDVMTTKSNVAASKGIGLVASPPVFNLKPYNLSDKTEARDIFSPATTVTPTGTVVSTPKGQLPGNLKVVGIIIANPSQIIIEDNMANKTYFISEGPAQDGFKIVRVGRDQMVLNYQGQDIDVPITKN